MESGTVVSWEKQVGDKLEEGDVLAEIETDKAVMSMETPYQGYLAKIIKPAGSQNVEINEPIAIIVSLKDEIAFFENFELSDASETTVKTTSPAHSEPTKVETQNEPRNDAKPTKVETQNQNELRKHADSARLKASPYAKKIAQETNIDLKLLANSGTGPDGRIISPDVLKFSHNQSIKPISTSSNYTDIPLTNMRKVIASRLTQSKQSIPHYYLSSEINMDNLMKLRANFNQKDNIKLSINDFVVKAAGICLTLIPESNSAWMDTYIRQYQNVDINIAVSTDTGLITPFIKDVNFKGLAQISKETKILAQKARENKLILSEFQGGTFTISNLGMFGIKSFSAIINPPQCGILAVGAIQKTIVPDYNDKPSVQNIMCATLCADHRIIDGALGATWLKNFKNLLEDPIQMLL